VGFVLGPRMNAAGRLDHAARSLELVMESTEPARGREIAAELDGLNQQRRADQAAILAEAETMAESRSGDEVLVLASPDWSHGIVGIVASKLAEKLGKPVLLGQVLGEKIKGSARSVPGFNMVEALRSQAELLTKFGGHFFAAGYTYPTEKLEALRDGLARYRRENAGTDDTAAAEEVELRWEDMREVNLELLDMLDLLEPHGNGNPRPRTRLDGLTVKTIRWVGGAQQHLSLKLTDGEGRVLGAIGFGFGGRYQDLREGMVVALGGTLNRNEFNGKVSLQMVLTELAYE
jgi:single-stranded-DNA-specific exonuclease